MTRRSYPVPALIPVILAGLVGLSGCPDNPYKASSWTKKLGGREHERAVQELEQLGDPSAIPELGRVWVEQGKPVRDLQVIIGLARPLTPKEAHDKFFTDYETTGREASWDKALPFLQQALTDVDEANSRSVDSATKAAEALGESQLTDGLPALVSLMLTCPNDSSTQKPEKLKWGTSWECAGGSKPTDRAVTKKLYQAQVAAIRAIGNYTNDKPPASTALGRFINRDPELNPRMAKDKAEGRAMEEKFGMYLGVTGASINALGELHVPTAASMLVLSLYRTPELTTQVRRALVASGPTAKEELKKILAGTHTEVEALFKAKKLDKYCGDKGDAPADQCQPVTARDFYAAVVLGDFYDPKTVPDLLNALKHPPAPAYYVDEQAGPTQYNAIFDALRKIGSGDAAAPVRAMWMTSAAGKVTPPKRGQAAAPAPQTADLATKILAISAYAFVTRDNTGVEELGKIAADNSADDGLRQAAAEAFARLSRNAKDIEVLEGLAKKYFDASDKKRKEADGKPKADADAADKVFNDAKKIVDEAKAKVLTTTRDTTKSAKDIKDATNAAKKAEDDFKVAKKKHKDATQPFKGADGAAKAYKGYARMFQTHIARIEIAIRCGKDKEELKCFAASLSLTPEMVEANMKPYLKDLGAWTTDDKLGLREGNIERAMLEIGKKGAAAAGYTDLLLDKATSDNRLIRQSILLALPKIAAVPCATCEEKLDKAIKAGEGKTTLGELNLETQMLRHYFSWAGGKTPSAKGQLDTPTQKPAETPAEKPAKSEPAEKPAKAEPAKTPPAKTPPAKTPPKKKGR